MKHPGLHSIRFLILFLLTVTGIGVSNAHADAIIDNGKAGTAYTGTWEVSGATGSYGTTSVFGRDGAKYTWTFTPAASGYCEVSMWWTEYSNRSTSIPVAITHGGGTSTVYINQKGNGGKWNVLGRYTFTAGQTYKVTITSQAGPSSTCADAVKFTYLAAAANEIPAVPEKYLHWVAPQAFTDSTPLVPSRDLQGYEIYIKQNPSFGSADNPVATVSPLENIYNLANVSPSLSKGVTYYVSMRSVAITGLKSDFPPGVPFSLP